ncbi:hypothetical protein [Geothrix campi]|uniref:hypothetical protein n=1 Tax=Geothrix campi TaxID=2966450 RepID=UPI0021490780|nr:hypothetical protein [Geothrix sp. SG10]
MASKDPAELQMLKEAKEALEAIQSFDVKSLIRERELGELSSFREVVEPAERLISLFRQISPETLEDLPTNILQGHIRDYAIQVMAYFNQILAFQPAQGQGARDQLISQITNYYVPTFSTLFPLIAYANTRTIDLGRVEREAKAVVDRVTKQAKDIEVSLQTQVNRVTEVVETVRKVAAEQGVTQQAIYFKDEASHHRTEADNWGKYTFWWAIGLGAWAITSLFLARWNWLKPEDAYQHVQLIVSKALVFAVISFMLYLSAKNYLAHRHNEVVNRHRQNALLTFEAFVKASGDPEAGKVILGQAAACVFAPQSTGYSQEGGIDAAKASSVVEVLARPITGGKG